MTAPVIQFKRGLLANLPGLRAGEPGFTTDSYDLYVGLTSETSDNKFFGSHRYWKKETASTGSGVNLVEANTGSDYITLAAPASVGAAVTYYFPATQGGASSVLTNDGSGNLTWSSGSANPVFSGIATFTDTTDNTLGDPNTGSVQIDGGLGVNKNVTVGAGLSVVGTSRFAGDVTFASAAYFGDGDKLYFGDSNDLEIYHNGENSFIKDAGTGTLNIVASGFSVLNAGSNETLANFTPDGSVELYYDNSKKFETTGVGATITGNLGVSGNLAVAGTSEFIGVATFRGGTINLGDSTGDDINVGGEFISGLFPNTTATYDLGDGSRQWRHGNFSGIVTASTGAVIDGVQIGISGANVIDTVSGNLTINSAGGQTIIDDLVTIQNNLTVNGNVTIGGTTINLRGTDVFIENKDIILGYTTSITPNDDTANHAGVAIASTVGSPLVSFTASGINTLPDTYKQMMWFKSGTLGFSTDAFAFNYGVAIGTATMANGVRLAVGSGITMSDTSISATTFYGSVVGNVSSADQVKTVTASNTNATYHLTFVDANNGSATNETVYTDDGIYYNPGTNTFTTQYGYFTGNVTVDGTITGTATTATRATTVDTTATSTNADYYVPFVDTLAGQNGETIRVGAGLSLNPSTGEVKTGGILSVGNPGALTSYIKAGGGSNALYLYSNGDVSFQAKAVVNEIRSSSNASTLITLSDLDATFARNVYVTGIATVNSNLVVGGDVRINGNDIQASDGNANITLTSNTLTTFAGDIKVGGNDIQASDGNTNITLTSNTLTEVKGDLQVTGNNIKSSTGANALSLSGSDVTVNGNLYVNGSTTQVNTAALTVEDRTIDLGIVNGVAPAADTTWDLGVLFNYYSSGAAKKSAVVWEHNDSRFKFASVLSADTDGSNNNTPQLTVTTFAPIEVGSLWVNDCAGQSQVISCTGTTRYLENITIDAGTF